MLFPKVLIAPVFKNLLQSYRCLFTSQHDISNEDEQKLFSYDQGNIKTQCKLCAESIVLTRIGNVGKSYMIETDEEYYHWKVYPPSKYDEFEHIAFSHYIPIKETYDNLKKLNIDTKQLKSLEPSFLELSDLIRNIQSYAAS